MTYHDDWTSRLSAYVDGELDSERQTALERHLAECVACRSTLEDLRAIAAAAPRYEGAEPPHDLWPGIAAAIAGRKQVRFPAGRSGDAVEHRPRWSARRFTARHLIAASLGAAAAGVGTGWLALRGSGSLGTSGEPARLAGAAPPAESRPVRLTADQAYDQAVADLEQVLAEGRDRLDPATVRVIEENLRIIDQAIAEARLAIASDSANVDLQSWIAANMRRKLDLLRRAASAVSLRSIES